MEQYPKEKYVASNLFDNNTTGDFFYESAQFELRSVLQKHSGLVWLLDDSMNVNTANKMMGPETQLMRQR